MPAAETEPPPDLRRRPGQLVAELCTRVPETEVARHCAHLLTGAEPAAYSWLLPWLAGVPGARYLDGGWPAYWPRVWGARGLLYAWTEDVAPAVVGGVDDGSWRVAEMCLKVARRHELPVAEPAERLLTAPLPRVRVAALRALAVCGEHEHLAAVRACVADQESPEVRRAAATALDAMADRLDQPPDGPASGLGRR